jgi:hypothetical protein
MGDPAKYLLPPFQRCVRHLWRHLALFSAAAALAEAPRHGMAVHRVVLHQTAPHSGRDNLSAAIAVVLRDNARTPRAADLQTLACSMLAKSALVLIVTDQQTMRVPRIGTIPGFLQTAAGDCRWDIGPSVPLPHAHY